MRTAGFLAAACSLAGLMASSGCGASDLTGRIDTIGPYLGGQNQIYISLKDTPGGTNPSGAPSGSCTNIFALATMDDTNFKSFVYPLILMAKASDSPITLRTSGCYGGYPLIVGVDFTPRS